MQYRERSYDRAGAIGVAYTMKPKPKLPKGYEPNWLETDAKVTACRYQFGGLQTLAFGLPEDQNHFTIDFTYHAHGKDFASSFLSPVAIGLGETITVFYNPLNPRENDKSFNSQARGIPLMAIGVAGSIVLSLLYLGLVRGCN